MQHKLIERTVPWMKQAEPFILIIDIGPGCSVCPSSARRYSVAFAVHLVFFKFLFFYCYFVALQELLFICRGGTFP